QASKNPYSSIQDRHLGTYLGEMFGVIKQQRLRLSLDTLLFWRALLLLDTNALRMSERLDLLTEMRHFFEQRQPGLFVQATQLMSNSDLSLEAVETVRLLMGYITSTLAN